MTKAATISGILFDKDGTLLDYAKSWIPVNYELARIAAAGDEDLSRKLLIAGGMDPDTGYVTPDSLLAAGNTVEIAEGFVGAGAPFTVEALTELFDGLFAKSSELAVAVTDLADFFATLHARGYWLGVASSDNEASIRATAKRFGFDGYLHYVAGYDSGFGIKPDEVPPPDSGSPSPRTAEKFVPVPDPYLKIRASRTQRSMRPPGSTSESFALWIKQAWGCGRV